MHTAKQLSVSLVNKPGRLAALLAALSKDKVGLQALVVMGAGAAGGVRFVPDDPAAAIACLEKNSTPYDAADVLLVEVPPQSGAFRRMCARLAAEHLNLDYAYCSFDGEQGAENRAMAVMRVNDLAKAQRVLGEGPKVLRRKEPKSGRRPVFAR